MTLITKIPWCTLCVFLDCALILYWDKLKILIAAPKIWFQREILLIRLGDICVYKTPKVTFDHKTAFINICVCQERIASVNCARNPRKSPPSRQFYLLFGVNREPSAIRMKFRWSHEFDYDIIGVKYGVDWSRYFCSIYESKFAFSYSFAIAHVSACFLWWNLSTYMGRIFFVVACMTVPGHSDSIVKQFYDSFVNDNHKFVVSFLSSWSVFVFPMVKSLRDWSYWSWLTQS